MAAQLSIRSDRARDLAHKLAKDQHRSVTKIVELALESYAREHEPEKESARSFVDKLREIDPNDTIDMDFEAHIREGRKPHRGIDLE
jgi:hypothetical protein